MANINILFDNKNYNIDESSFSSASAKLKSHLSTVMNGTGAVINIGGVPYNVDSAKLSTAMNAFITHLGTISGSGSKLVVNGVQYNINSAKLSDAITELHNVLGGLHSDGGETTTSIAYGCKYRLNGVQSNGYVVMHENGTLESYNIDDTLESSITVQYVMSNDGKTSVNVDGAEVGYVTADGKTFYMFMGEENGERIYYPFYLEESDNEDEQREVILAEQVVEEFLEEEQGLYGAYMINNLDLFEIGRTYIVNWDGTEYRYEAVELEGVGVIGEEDSKNPFLMVVMPKEYTNLSGNALAIYTTSTQSTHTVAIYKVVSDNDSTDSGLNEYGFYFGVPYSATLDVDGGVYKLIYVFHEDGSANFKLYIDGVLSEESSVDSVVYDQNKATFPDGMVIIFTENGTKFVDPNDITCTLESSSTSSLNEYGFYYDTKYSCYNYSSDSGLPVGELSFFFKEDQTVDMCLDNNLIQTLSVTYSDKAIAIPSFGMTLNVVADGRELSVPSMFALKLGDSVVVDGDYTYKMNMYDDSLCWRVFVNDNTKSTYGAIKDEIDEYPVMDLNSTFSDCTNLTTAPVIPSSVKYMNHTFRNCENLTTAPIIPDGVINMNGTFSECTSLTTASEIPASVTNMIQTFFACSYLTGSVEINANPTKYNGCFIYTEKPITITGSCSDETKAALAATANNNNVTY